MKIIPYTTIEELEFTKYETHEGAELIGLKNGTKNGFCIGISVYHSEHYGKPGIHNNQEGFYVIEGTGKAKIGDNEFSISPGMGFLVMANVAHTIKKDPNSIPIRLIWAHDCK